MTKEEYQKRQAECDREKFEVETNRRLQGLELGQIAVLKSLNTLCGDFSSLDSSCNSQIKEIMDATVSSLKEFRQAIGDFQSHIQKQDEKIKGVQEDQKLSINEEGLNTYLKPLRKIVEDLCDTQTKMHREYNGLIERLKIDLTNQLKSLKEELISRPTGIPELQKLLESKIELVELNGQNAVLRSSNNEKQILLVERKIENIYQLIKRLDLNKQE